MVIQRLSDLAWIAQGICKVHQVQLRLACEKYSHLLNTSSVLQPVLGKYCKQEHDTDFEHHESESFEDGPDTDQHSDGPVPPPDDIPGASPTGTINPARTFSTMTSHAGRCLPCRNLEFLKNRTFGARRNFHTTANSFAITAEELGKIAELADKRRRESPSQHEKLPNVKVDYSSQKLSSRSKAKRVPSSRIGRVASFGGLAAGLMVGTVSEFAKKTLGVSGAGAGDSAFPTSALMSDANLERIVNTLCRVRGAALKLGQMLSIQDDSIIDPQLLAVFERVRQSADFMPVSQMKKVLVQELGPDWHEKLAHFEDKPFAAASIGQVHKGILHDGREVAIKIRYPGVANSIDSDIDNLVTLLKFWNLFPEQFFMDKFISVARKELALECDYIREAEYSRKFKQMLSDDDRYNIPEVIPELSTRQVLTTELITGMPLDQVTNLDQEHRDYVARSMLSLLLREIFEFRSMQTDPNWSNFFYNPEERKLHLLDFGASRDYPELFVDDYIEVVKAAAVGDRKTVLEKSQKLEFLTGYESKVMEEAHIDAVMILGEPFASEKEFDFSVQDTTRRIARLMPTMLEHRLTPPPEESYSLHRKLSGGFLLAAKLRSKFSCKREFDILYDAYHARKQSSQ